MADLIIQTGDEVKFIQMFPPAIVDVKPGKINGSGKSTLKGKKICVLGDEKKVKVAGCTYMTPAFPVKGTGTLMIEKLLPNQTTKKAKSGGKAIILKGAKFMAKFQVQAPAKLITPQGPQMDPMKMYKGFGEFKNKNTKVKAT